MTLREEHRLKVFESRVLRRIFLPVRYQVAGGKGKLRNELRNLYTLSSVVRMKVRWVGNVACVGEKWNAYRILLGSQKERDHWEDDVGGWIILKWLLDRMGWYGQDRDQWRALVIT
jgi:hypothetical protein